MAGQADAAAVEEVAEGAVAELEQVDAGVFGGVGFQGSILAPYADVTFYNGQIRGQIISWSLTGNVELYWNAFTGTVDCASWNAFKAAQIAAGTWGSTF